MAFIIFGIIFGMSTLSSHSSIFSKYHSYVHFGSSYLLGEALGCCEGLSSCDSEAAFYTVVYIYLGRYHQSAKTSRIRRYIVRRLCATSRDHHKYLTPDIAMLMAHKILYNVGISICGSVTSPIGPSDVWELKGSPNYAS